MRDGFLMALRVPGRGALIAHVPRHAWALSVCAAALLVGVLVVDDYGVMIDAEQNQRIAEMNLRYLAGDDDAFNALVDSGVRYYGAAFELPLQFVERIFSLDDSRSLYLCRHLLTHLFFVAGGFAAYLLAWRMFRRRGLALFALVVFLLHPRIYAHSFFNPKDPPFASMFMICLLLGHRAFEKATPGAFALCGLAAGLLTNLRVLGAVFPVVLLAARVCDLVRAREWPERRRVGATSGLFALVAALTYYVSMPSLWGDPAERFVEMLGTLSARPNPYPQAFFGETVLRVDVPAHYLPVWFAITTPPLMLLLGLAGAAALVLRGAGAAGALARDAAPRFLAVIVACMAVPVLAVVALRSTLYDDWRHMYFLWGPFALLATLGLRALVALPERLPERRLRRRFQVAVYCLTALGLGLVVAQMAALHPYESYYFNALVDRRGPEELRKRFHLYDYGSVKGGHGYILDQYPDAVLKLGRSTSWLGVDAPRHLETLPRRQRTRAKVDTNADPEFYVVRQDNREDFPLGAADELFAPVVYTRKVYGNTVWRVATPDPSRVGARTADRMRAIYRETTAGAPTLTGDFDTHEAIYGGWAPLAGPFDVYHDEGTITWVKEDCPPGGVSRKPRLTVHPADANLHRAYKQRAHGVRVDGACMWRLALPDYDIAQLHVHGAGRITPRAYLSELRRRHARLRSRTPAASSTFDVYLDAGGLTYIKTPCAAADAEAPFFLHVLPANAGDQFVGVNRMLAALRALLGGRPGFVTLNFRWHGEGRRLGDVVGTIADDLCMATRQLPPYPIASIATGQIAADGAELWRVEFSVGD